MSVFRLLFREIQHRKLNFLLGLVSVVAAVGMLVCVLTLCQASQRETIRLMRNLGFNVLIVPQNTNMADFWSEDFAREEMPEEYVYRLARTKQISIRHLIARLQKKIDWRGRKVLLTGILPEVQMAFKSAKDSMGWTIPRGRVYVGFELARNLNIQRGDTLTLGGKELIVDRCLEEKGSKDDIRIYGHLHDIQEILGKPGLINEIEALSCQCEGERLPRIRQELARILPDTRVTEFRSIAVARAEQRRVVEKYTLYLSPVILVVCGLWIGLLALSNVRERRGEIGLWRALGVGSGKIGALFLGRAGVLGVVGAGLGFVLGTGLALRIGPQVFPLTAPKIVPLYSLLGWSLVGTPLLCVVASYLPALAAITQDPAEILREE